MPNSVSKRRDSKRGSRTDAKLEAQMWVHFQTSCSVAKTAAHFGTPWSTANGVLERMASERGESLARARDAARARLVELATEKAAATLEAYDPMLVEGSKGCSRGLELARAASDIGRVASVLASKDDAQTTSPVTVVVQPGFGPPAPPPDEPPTAAGDAQDSTLTK